MPMDERETEERGKSSSSSSFFFLQRRYKYRAYQFLNHPRGFIAIAYQLLVILLIVGCLLTTMFYSTYDDGGYRVLFLFDLTILILFLSEFIVRIWSMTFLNKYQGLTGIFLLLTNPVYLLDFAVIAATITALVYDSRKNVLSVLLRGFRMLQFFETRYQLWKLFSAAIWMQRFQLMVCMYLCLVVLLLVAFVFYYLEQSHNPNVDSVAKAVWFMLTTFTTVGYGDIVPVTTSGKIVTGIFMLLGTSIFCLPGGVIGASLALKINEGRSLRSNVVRRNFAATLIQAAWRVFWARESAFRKRRMSLVAHFRKGFSNGKGTLKESFSLPHETLRDINVQTFVNLLKLGVARRKFRLSGYLCDTDTFYETYTSDTMCMNEMIRNLEVKIDRIEDLLDFEANRGDLLRSILGDKAMIGALGRSIARKMRSNTTGAAWRQATSRVRSSSKSTNTFKATSRKVNELDKVELQKQVRNYQTRKLIATASRKVWKTPKSSARSLHSFNMNRSVHFAPDDEIRSYYDHLST